MSTRLKTLLLVLVSAILAIAGFLWWQNAQQPAKAPSGLGSELYQETVNPAENLIDPLKNKPEVNPLSGANPFSDVKINPFK